MRGHEADSSANDLVRACAILRSFPERWWIAGGWALELHSPEIHRPHQDVDIAVLRQDQTSLRRFLSGWTVHKVVGGKRELWPEEEQLALPIHEIQAKRRETTLEFLLNECMGGRWLFRRNLDVSLALSSLGRFSSLGVPYLCPQVVLLCKAKNPRRIDQDDFERTLPTLRSSDREWLSQALQICHPQHEWLSRL